uniref:Uncharacterized protein n=1 Tax=Odontella aurita TaxID=265563 RepID=A0A6U6EHT8_9STRA|mmetsp:Transcript_25143/g.73755  ORF Transcript_25143/g.73755 Transcript_25143/m.73755 type:complete len:280 (+) Transcript_25143:1356-2195(+)
MGGGEEGEGDAAAAEKEEEYSSRAESLYRRALSYDPNDGDASYNLALLLQDRRGDEYATREAAALYSVAASSDPDRWDAWANMAAALTELRERPLEAARAYERSIVLLQGDGGEEESEEERDPSEIDPYLSALYYGYGLQLADLTPGACLILARAPRSLLIGKERLTPPSSSNEDEGAADPDDASEDEDEASADLATAKDLCSENARNALRAASALDPHNVQAAHMLAAIEAEMGRSSGASAVRRAAPEFVSALFDDFADTFDAKLGALGYRVPRRSYR